MSRSEYLIAGIRKQKDLLEHLLYALEQKNSFDFYDYQKCEYSTREVEKGLKRIRHIAADEILKEIVICPDFND